MNLNMKESNFKLPYQIILKILYGKIWNLQSSIGVKENYFYYLFHLLLSLSVS